MFYNNQYSSFTNQQMNYPQYQGFQTHPQQQHQHSSQLLNGFAAQQQQQYPTNQLFAPKPINNFGYSAQNQFVKSSSPMQLNHASFTSNNQDQYSENSTSCGSEENQQDDFLDQMPQLQPTLSFKNIQAASPAISLNPQQQLNNNTIQKIAPKLATASVTPNNAPSQVAPASVIPEEAKYKTEMCKNWVENGKCNYGDKCKFAHGKNELVQKVAANKHFKTKKCKQYYESCVCNYGPRCHFVHDIRTVAEIKANNEYSKKLLHPEIFLDLSSSSSLTSISSSQPSTSRRLDIFQKLTSSQTSFISNTTSQ